MFHLWKPLLHTFNDFRNDPMWKLMIYFMYLSMQLFVDQHIIHLMQQYEINGVDTSEFRYAQHAIDVTGWFSGVMYYYSPYLWSNTAVDQFKERQKKGWVLCKQPGMAEVLDMLDKNMIKRSTTNFPITISLEVCIYD